MPGNATAWELERLLWEADTESGLHPEELHELADATGRSVRLLVPPDGRLDHFDAVFERAVDAVSERATDAVSERATDAVSERAVDAVFAPATEEGGMR